MVQDNTEEESFLHKPIQPYLVELMYAHLGTDENVIWGVTADAFLITKLKHVSQSQVDMEDKLEAFWLSLAVWKWAVDRAKKELVLRIQADGSGHKLTNSM